MKAEYIFLSLLAFAKRRCYAVKPTIPVEVAQMPVAKDTNPIQEPAPKINPIKVSKQQPISPANPNSPIPQWKGNSATLTWFNDGAVQCYNDKRPAGPGFAVNPKLLGFSAQDYADRFRNTAPTNIPWCGRRLKLTVNGKSIEGTIVDTCDPIGGPGGGGKCDFDNVIDLLGQEGQNFLKSAVGDDFYRGTVNWEIY